MCHACVGDSPPRKCQWLPPPGDFPLMTTVQTLRWKHIAEQREAQRRELIWRDLDGEVRTLSGQQVGGPAGAPGADGRCIQCDRDCAPATLDGGYCSECWLSRCWICGCWAPGLQRAGAPERWQCSSCSCLTPSAQDSLHAVAATLEASFTSWHSSWRHYTFHQVRAAKATLPVPQPAKVADWLYIGDLHDIQMLVAEGPRALSFEGILSLCSEGMRKVEGIDRFGHLQISGCAHQVLAASDSDGFDMISVALPAAISFVTPFFARRAPVLVHCHTGMNRSAFIVVALLILLEGMPLTDALRAVTAARGKVLTNRSLRAQLLEIAVRAGRWP